MLRILREHATSWMLRGILVLVAVTFISWGGYSLVRQKKETYAAKVNDAVIDLKDYQEAYQNTIKQYRDFLGPNFSEKAIAELRLKEKVLDNLIERALILQEATRLGVTVSDEELKQSIESIPAFQFNGQFDPRAYERALRLNRLTSADFERIQRESLMGSKLVGLIRQSGGKVSEDEILLTYLFENEPTNLAFIKVSPESYRGQVETNDIEMKDYYQKHQEEFRVPTSVQIQYLAFRPGDFEGRVQASPEDIKRYYDTNKERFRTPKRVKAREILIKAGPQDPQDKADEKRKKAEEILEKAKKTKDFASLAKQFSESPTAAKGGDVGWLQRGGVEEAAEGTLLSLKPGEVSGVVRTRQGFQIYRADEVAEERERPLEEVKDQIIQALRKEKAKTMASRQSEDAFYSLFRSRDLEGYAKEHNVPIRTTGFFKEGDELPDIGREPSFSSSAFSLKPGEMSAVVSAPPNFYLLKLVDKKDSRIPSLDEVRDQVRRKVLAQRTDEWARKTAEELLKEAQGGKDLKVLAREKGLPVDETGFVTRAAGMIPKVGPAGEFMKDLSSLNEKQPVPKEVLKTKDGYFVMKLVGAQPADQAKFPTVKKDLERRLLLQKQESFFQSWLQQLKDKSSIERNKDLVSS